MNSGDALRMTLDRAGRDGWSGSDPYDALLSPVGGVVTRLGSLPRFALSQIVLRMPVARDMANPPRSVNPKALGIFLGAVMRGRAALGEMRARVLVRELLGKLERRATSVGSGLGWGYPFPWQSRSFWAPADTPNAVVTATAGWHALDCADALGDSRARALGIGAANFLASRFHVTPTDPDGGALSYTHGDKTRVVNISALAARLLLRASVLRDDQDLAALGGKLLRFVIRAQRPDGSWPYAVDRGGEWTDSFHTGFVLEALLQARDMGYPVPDAVLNRGFEAYGRFFGSDGSARLLLRPSAPLDAHSAAQGVITYAALAASKGTSPSERNSAQVAAVAIADWALRDLWIPGEGYFAYQIRGGRRDEREFLRWVQSWMAYAMATVEWLRAAQESVSAPAGAA